MNNAVVHLRRSLHRHPELSGQEINTANTVLEFFKELGPDLSIRSLGGSGLAFVFDGEQAGPTVLLRCDMDALPIREQNQFEHCSNIDGVSHKCGHDGHMAILAAVGIELAKNRPGRGRVVLLYQPAEENGHGAAAVLADPKFAQIAPDFAFALHNLPGYPLGQVIICPGAFNCASRGMAITLTGRTAHAAQPETGISPAGAMCELVRALACLPPEILQANELGFVTVVGAELGRKAFGTSPGKAQIWATLRSETDETMASIVRFLEDLVDSTAKVHGLRAAIQYEDVFQAVVNSVDATRTVIGAVDPGMLLVPEKPFRWSEDFGRIIATCEGALFGVGAGERVPDLHNPDYDFPDQLIQPARDILLDILENCLEEN